MNGKYKSLPHFAAAAIIRELQRALLRTTISWKRECQIAKGYTLCIGCSRQLTEMLTANLRFLQRQHLIDLHQTILVMDDVRQAADALREEALKTSFPELNLVFFYYSQYQGRVSNFLRKPYCFSWLSWCIAIANCETRLAILHDFDALLIDDTFLQKLHDACELNKANWCGISYYNGNGITGDDALLTTFEMCLDVGYIRRTLNPIDLFNKVSLFRGKAVDFDTTLHAQSRYGIGHLMPVHEESLVHPRQVVHQFTMLRLHPRYVPPDNNSLLMIPYFLHLGGDSGILKQSVEDLSAKRTIRLWSHPVDTSLLTTAHAKWLTKQAGRSEISLHGAVRAEVGAYFTELERVAETNGCRD